MNEYVMTGADQDSSSLAHDDSKKHRSKTKHVDWMKSEKKKEVEITGNKNEKCKQKRNAWNSMNAKYYSQFAW